MRTIYKFPLFPADRQTLQLPVGAEVLSAGEQEGRIVVWVLLDPDISLTERVFYIVGTGHEVPPSPNLKFVSTVQMQNGLVFHVFVE